MIHSNTHDRRCCHVHLPLAALAFVFLDPASALAGMPVVLLTDMARMRIQTISFFLMGLLLSSKLIQWIWNSLGRDFAILPRLSYTKALGVVTLWGLLFVLVLTMISGARELMTPGAWEKNGATYRLPKPSTEVSPSTDDSSESVRYSKLENLRQALWQYAATHQGRFPADRNFAEVPSEKWQLPDPSGLRYLYVGSLQAGKETAPLAYEPEYYDSGRLVLFTDGHIERLQNGDLDHALRAEKR